MNYINQDGEAAVSQTVTLNTVATNIGTLAHCQAETSATGGWAIPLADGDTGVRSVTSFQMVSTSGGLFAVVLIKPITIMNNYSQGYTSEVDFIRMKALLPEVKNGAYLGLLSNALSSIASATILGTINYVWSEE